MGTPDVKLVEIINVLRAAQVGLSSTSTGLERDLIRPRVTVLLTRLREVEKSPYREEIRALPRGARRCVDGLE